MTLTIRRWLARALTAFLILAFLIAVVTSPLWLGKAYTHVSLANLQRYGLIAGGYAFASAFVAALAFSAVACSIGLQARTSRIAMQQSLRSLHFDLLKLALDDPTLLTAWGPFSSIEEQNAQRQHIYVNMIVQHWWLMFESGALSINHLKAVSEELMRGEPARRYWEVARSAQLSEAKSVRRKQFTKCLNAAFTAAVMNQPASTDARSGHRARKV